jgi:hypothetical protein
MTAHVVFKFHFNADMHADPGRTIAEAAGVRLRPQEIDNQWKDTIGRGKVESLSVSIDRTNTPNRWALSAITPQDGYDRAAASALRSRVLAALEQHAQEYRELASELHPDG